MVTIVIFAFVMVMLFSSFNAFVSTGQSIAGGLDYNQRVRDAFNRISEDLQGVYLASVQELSVEDDAAVDSNPLQMAGQQTTVGGKTFSTMSFAAVAGLETGRSKPAGVVQVIYYVRQNSRNGFDLCRAERRIGSDAETKPCTDPRLAENIAGFTIGFIDSDETDSTDWDSKSKDTGQTMPAAVTITLTLKAGEKEKTFETAVYLPVKGESHE